MRVADHVARWLADAGIKHAFGIIGGGNVVLWDAIADLGETEIVCCHHEQAAAMAATYYARTTGRLGFTLVTTGAGSANAITGVMAAHMDGVPLLVISGNEATRYMGKSTRIWGVQGYDSTTVAETFTKWSVRAQEGRPCLRILDAMAGMANLCPKGPVWLDIPKDLQGAEL